MANSSVDRCLSTFDFASFLSGTIFGERLQTVESHLQHCDPCYELYINTLNHYYEQMAPEPKHGSHSHLGDLGFVF